MQYRMQILTSHEIQFFSCKPIACAPLEMSGIQKALTQLKGSITDHLEDNLRRIYHIVHNKEDFDINTSCIARNHAQSQQGIKTKIMMHLPKQNDYHMHDHYILHDA